MSFYVKGAEAIWLSTTGIRTCRRHVNSRTKMAVGMVFSNEPMLVVPDKFGVRLEDHFYLTEQGPSWFTQPSESIDDPFAS